MLHGYFDWSMIGRDASVTYGAYAMGSWLLVGLLVNSVRLRLAACVLLGWIGFLLYVSQRHRNPVLASYWLDLAAITGAALGAGLLMSGWAVLPGPLGRGLRQRIREVLAPDQWGAGETRRTSHDRVTSWFVAITAATTGATFFQMAEPSFWHAALHALTPSRLIYTLIIVIVPLVLVGPIEEYVIGYGVSGRPAEAPARELALVSVTSQFSWRAAGRLVVVVVVMLQLSVFHSSFEETLGRGKLVASDLMMAGFGPGLIGYYWASALQVDRQRVARRSTAAATLAAFLFFLPAAWLSIATDFMLRASSGEPGRIAMFYGGLPLHVLSVGQVLSAGGNAIPLAMLAAAAIAALICVQSVLGGLVLSRGRTTWPLLGLFALLFLALLAPRLAVSVGMVPLGASHRMFWLDVAQTLLTALGATLGLALSGFPQIVTQARVART